MSEERSDERVNRALQHLEKWDPVIEDLLRDPTLRVSCPYRSRPTVRVSWTMFVGTPRTASFDIWCSACGEREHCALLLPPESPDNYRK